MKALIQRVSEASVQVNNKNIAQISKGYLILLGVKNDDSIKDSIWLANKIARLRIFPDKEGRMNMSIVDISGEIIVVSQFTLLAETSKGNRPSYRKAAKPINAIYLYNHFKQNLASLISNEIQSGEFGTNMKVSLINDGPVTIFLDTKDSKDCNLNNENGNSKY